MPKLRSICAIGLLACFACACGGGATATPPAATPGLPAATTRPTSAPVATTPPAPTNAAGIRTCVSSSEGPERECPLDAGTYATEGMRPALTYTVPSPGWASLNRTIAPGNFHLFPPGGSMSGFSEGTTDAITVISAAVPPGLCTGEPSEEFPGTYAGLLDFLAANTRVEITNLRDASVAGLHGKVMDVAYAEGDGCSEGDYSDLLIGVDPSHGGFGVAPATLTTRMYVLQLPGSEHPLSITVDDAKNGGSAYADGDPWLDAADAVIQSFVITP